MKTPSLTPWCNLFSTASKYNITVKESKYKLMLYVSCAITLLALLMISFTHYYHFMLSIWVVLVFILGIWLASKKDQKIVLRFLLHKEGLCSFLDSTEGIEHYQLLKGSQYSFLGCWLLLQPTSQLSNSNIIKQYINSCPKKRVFIYRDSVSEQDFSRLSNVISQLNYHP